MDRKIAVIGQLYQRVRYKKMLSEGNNETSPEIKQESARGCNRTDDTESSNRKDISGPLTKPIEPHIWGRRTLKGELDILSARAHRVNTYKTYLARIPSQNPDDPRGEPLHRGDLRQIGCHGVGKSGYPDMRRGEEQAGAMEEIRTAENSS